MRPGRVSPETQAERELLARLDTLPAHEPVTHGDQVFVAEPAYAAASGRDCRSITIRSTEGDRQARIKLACEDRAGWVFVPDPFATGVATQVPPRESQP
ncbi:MAG: DVU3141 family protein [Myxococcota bacterium]